LHKQHGARVPSSPQKPQHLKICTTSLKGSKDGTIGQATC
jgi:hypothetical protein